MELELAGHLGVDFRIATLRIKNNDRILKIEVSGRYGHDTGHLLPMIVAAALANPFGPGEGMIFDASNLDYKGGDELLDWVHIAQKEANGGYTVAIVTSAQNHEHVVSLAADLEMHALEGAIHQSLSAARNALENVLSRSSSKA